MLINKDVTIDPNIVLFTLEGIQGKFLIVEGNTVDSILEAAKKFIIFNLINHS